MVKKRGREREREERGRGVRKRETMRDMVKTQNPWDREEGGEKTPGML